MSLVQEDGETDTEEGGEKEVYEALPLSFDHNSREEREQVWAVWCGMVEGEGLVDEGLVDCKSCLVLPPPTNAHRPMSHISYPTINP